MKKLLLILLILLGIFLGLIIAIPILFKGKIVEKIKQVVNEELTATVNFNNDIGLSLLRSFPNLSLDIENIEIINSGKFEGDTLLSMKEFSATLDIMSVIKGDEIRIRALTLDEPRIHALVLADGSANWDIVKPSESEEEVDTSTSEDSPFQISLKKYEVKNAYVVYDDEQANMRAELVGFNHSGKGDFSQDDFILETLTSIQSLSYSMDGIAYLNKVNTELNCNLGMNMPNMRFDFKENSLRLNALVIGFDGFLAMPDDNMSMDLKVRSEKTSLKEILSLIPTVYTKDFDKLQTTGNTALDLKLNGTLNTELEVYPAFEVKFLVENGTFSYPDLPEKLSDIQVNLRVNNADGNLDHTVVNLDRLHFLFGKEAFDAKMLLTKPMSNPYIDLMAKGLVVLDNVSKLMPLEQGTKLGGRLQCDLTAKGNVSTFEGDDYEAINAAGTLAIQNLVYSDGKSLPVEISNLGMEFSPKEVTLSALTGKYGHSDYSATGSMQNYLGYMFKEGETLKGNLDLKSNLFDCNAFLTEDAEQVEAPTPADTMELEAFLVPENIDFNLNLGMNKVLYDNLTLTEVKGNAKISEQILYLNDVQVGVFGGKMSMNGTYNTTNPVQPATKIKLTMEDVEVKQTFNFMNSIKTIAPIAEYITGKMNASIDLSTLLNRDMSPILSSITSEGLLKTTEAVISGFQPLNALADKLQLNNLKSVNISRQMVAYAISDGKVSLKKPIDLNVENILLHVQEEGYTTFDQLLNYRLKLTIPKALLGGAGNEAINGLLGEAGKLGLNVKTSDKITINALLGGTVKSPKITTSLNEIKEDAVNQIRDEVNKVIDEKKDEVIKKADAEAQKLINQASQKGDQLIAEAKKQSDRLKAEAKLKGDLAIAEANKRSDELLKEAGSNPIKKLAAQKAGDKLKQEAQTRANQLNNEADKQGQDLIKKAENEKAKLIAEAEAKKNAAK